MRPQQEEGENRMVSIRATLVSGRRKVYSSACSASRELSGIGSNHLRQQISRVARTGGYIGRVWVETVRSQNV